MDRETRSAAPFTAAAGSASASRAVTVRESRRTSIWQRVSLFPPGRLFHVVSMGSGKMPSYAALLTPGERWKVVGYVVTQLQGKPPATATATGGTP